jgi:secreted PhoX family phosphatase
MVALVQRVGRPIPALVRGYVQQYATGSLPGAAVFPLGNGTGEEVRTISNVGHQVVASWLDPLTPNEAPEAPRYGANNDYIAYFGDGWDADWQGDVVASAPQFRGSGTSGWIWTNHEYISNNRPTRTSAPTGQHLTFARWLKDAGLLANDVTAPIWAQADLDAYIRQYKRQLGGSWFRVELDPETRRWRLARNHGAVRYDSTSETLLAFTGHRPRGLDHDDASSILPPRLGAGIAGDCSGAQTPWGTVVTAEENVQDYYGDLEACWTSAQRFVAGAGFDPGAFITPPIAASSNGEYSAIVEPGGDHNRDLYGFLVEIDPGQPAGFLYLSTAQGGDGLGHRKVGSFGRARWENATFAVGRDLRLVDGEPLVVYAGDDRRSGRLYKWVSQAPYRNGMTRGQVRSLLDGGYLYVAHFAGLDNATGLTLLATGAPPSEAAPGVGRWILLSVHSQDLVPNGAALGAPQRTVGEALKSWTWNGLGGFRNDNDVRLALFTAANKIGVMELNRPEDLEWNARDASGTPRLYLAFTNHGRQVALDQDGVLFDPAEHATASPLRPDTLGAVFALEEADPRHPAASRTFEFWQAWAGTEGSGLFDAANPDNIMLDAAGGVWFGTDGNFGRNGGSDALYYLDLDPAHRTGRPGIAQPTYGLAFRIAAVPSDAEATGPAFSSDQATIFLNVQHPGEDFQGSPSQWPPR